MNATHPDRILAEQADMLERLLPTLMRRLFTLEPDYVASELPVAQLRVCRILQEGPRCVSVIGEELGISASAVTQIADRLERAGLVERAVDSEDRRLRPLRLTPEGAEMMRSRREARLQRAAAVLARLSPEERAAVLRALEGLLQACTPYPLDY